MSTGMRPGSFNSSYNRQTFDITRFAQPGHTHTLAVRVDTRPRGFEFDTNDDWSLSGISRDVLLFALPKVHIDDITIHTSMDGQVDIEALVAGKGKKDKTVIEGEITDAEGNRVARWRQPPPPLPATGLQPVCRNRTCGRPRRPICTP